MIELLISSILYGLVAYTLYKAGLTIKTCSFWIVIASMICIQVLYQIS